MSSSNFPILNLAFKNSYGTGSYLYALVRIIPVFTVLLPIQNVECGARIFKLATVFVEQWHQIFYIICHTVLILLVQDLLKHKTSKKQNLRL
jgi:hypothetical protein